MVKRGNQRKELARHVTMPAVQVSEGTSAQQSELNEHAEMYAGEVGRAGPPQMRSA